ncbi:DUF2860 domain-containing protein [Vibrio sp. RE86]|uniref:DUF2860 domain-containing protein n=1 Tax=Vibrio sp. RE86 TaxID=2607605 RepID=UPI0014932D56|nr:DUF2860 domain-containing protein [Vibrio sp. RE86]NOH81407.1 DUF2860 domain-containing protein [Vibrio sp. RE86]
MKAQLTLIALSIFAAPTFAQLSDQEGISGEISLNTGYMSSSSNFDTDGDKTINDLNQKAKTNSDFIALPLGSIAYTFGTNLDKQVYAGTAREDIAVGNLALEIGYKQALESGMVIDISFLPTIMSGETWADPYQLGSERNTTDETGNAYRLKFDSIMGSNFSLDTAYATKDISDEKSGQSELTDINDINSLKRSSSSIYIKGDYQYALNKTSFLQPSLIYVKTDADGKANSSTAFGGEVSYFKMINKHQFALTAGYTQRSFDAVNPLYGKTRDESELSLFAAYEYQEFMGWEDWSLISFAGYGTTDANIDFYDEDEYFMSLGVNYQF